MGIKPTVGRIVHYRDAGPNGSIEAAVICGVNSDDNVNLSVFDMMGSGPYQRTSVHLKQDDDEMPPAPYCEWMEFQKGQAEKADTKGGLVDRIEKLEATVAAAPPEKATKPTNDK